MITNEEIVAKLTEKRNKDAKQVTDKWITERAKKLLTRVTEETVLDELVADSLEDMVDTQLTINSVLAEEAKKNPKPPKTPEPPKPTDPPKVELPQEYVEMFEKIKAREAQDAIKARKEQIFNLTKTKVNEAQQAGLKRIIELQTINMEDSDDVISANIMQVYTDFQKDFVGNIDPNKPDGSGKSKEDNAKMFEDIAKRNGI